MRSPSACASLVFLLTLAACAQTPAPGSSSSKHSRSSLPQPKAELDPGSVVNGVYRNRALGISLKIPAGWVLRTQELNATDEGADAGTASASKETGAERGKVLLAAFSRPPEAKGEDVNSSILIAAEPQATYPGLKEAAQYFGPLTEVARAQGFAVDEEPYEIAVGARTLVRSDFHKDVGARVMHQSTLAMLGHGYAVSITLLGGTEDEIETLIDGLDVVGK